MFCLFVCCKSTPRRGRGDDRTMPIKCGSFLERRLSSGVCSQAGRILAVGLLARNTVWSTTLCARGGHFSCGDWRRTWLGSLPGWFASICIVATFFPFSLPSCMLFSLLFARPVWRTDCLNAAREVTGYLRGPVTLNRPRQLCSLAPFFQYLQSIVFCPACVVLVDRGLCSSVVRSSSSSPRSGLFCTGQACLLHRLTDQMNCT